MADVHWFNLLGPFLDGQADSNGGANATSSTTLQSYNNVLWGCPAWPRDGAASNSKIGLGMNKYPLSDNNVVNYTISIFDPAEMAGYITNRDFTWAMISKRSNRILYGDATDWFLASFSNATVPSNAALTRHRQRSSYVFYDLHAATLAPSAVPFGLIDPDHLP